MDDTIIAKLTSGRVASREEILNDFDCVIMPKPLVKDLAQIHEGSIVGLGALRTAKRDYSNIH